MLYCQIHNGVLGMFRAQFTILTRYSAYQSDQNSHFERQTTRWAYTPIAMDGWSLDAKQKSALVTAFDVTT